MIIYFSTINAHQLCDLEIATWKMYNKKMFEIELFFLKFDVMICW